MCYCNVPERRFIHLKIVEYMCNDIAFLALELNAAGEYRIVQGVVRGIKSVGLCGKHGKCPSNVILVSR